MCGADREAVADKVIDILRKFVAGELSPIPFEELLHAQADDFERFLENDPHLERSNYVDGSTFQYLLACSFSDAGGILDAQGAICDYFDRNEYEYQKDNTFSELYDLILSASPRWLDPSHRYVQDQILVNAGARTGKELKSWLREELQKHYRCASKPPRWKQDASWPHGKDGPMVFLGQFNVNDYFHDTASVFVFYDEVTRGTETLIQCM